MKKLFLLMVAMIVTQTAYSQIDNSIWDSLKTVSNDYYELQVPYKWREIPGDVRTQLFFEASGLALPPFIDGSPVIVTVFLYKEDGTDLEDCKDKDLKSFRDNPGREFPENFEDKQRKTVLKSGQDAYILNTHFFRKEKDLNQSRFDLVSYSEKAMTGYVFGVSIQYDDKEYNFEKDKKLAAFAKKLFSYFELK